MERNIEQLTSLKQLGVANPIEGEKNLLSGTILLRNGLNATPILHNMRVVHHAAPGHRVAAARQRNPNRVPGGDVIRVRDLIRHLDLRVLHQTSENGGGYVVERVPFLDLVAGNLVGEAGAVAAAAGEGDFDDLAGSHARGVGGEVVGAENVREVFHGEEGLDAAEGGAVWVGVVGECVTRGVL